MSTSAAVRTYPLVEVRGDDTPEMRLERWKLALWRLTRGERADLAKFLVESLTLPLPDEEPLSLEEQEEDDAAFRRELDRRMQEVREGKVKMIPAEEVMASLRERYG